MNNVVFKKGDKVKCSKFVYESDNQYKEMVGVFVRYNCYGDNIAYVNFGPSLKFIACYIPYIKSALVKYQQLYFEYPE